MRESPGRHDGPTLYDAVARRHKSEVIVTYSLAGPIIRITQIFLQPHLWNDDLDRRSSMCDSAILHTCSRPSEYISNQHSRTHLPR